MADKEAQLRLRLTAQNEASPAFTAAEEAMKSMGSVMGEVTQSVREALQSVTTATADLTRNMAEVARSSDTSMSDMSKVASEDARVTNEAFSSMRQAMVDMTASIERSSAQVASAMTTMSESSARSSGVFRENSLGALIAVQMLGHSMEQVGSAGEHMFKYAVEQGADFQQSMKNIQVVIAANDASQGSWNTKMGDAVGITQQLQDEALNLGSRGAQSANQVAAAMDAMIRSGVDAKAVLGGAAQAAQNVAIVTGDSLDETANIITEVYHQFREAFNSNGKSIQENMKQTGDVISGTLLSARINSQDFLNTLKYVGPVASQLGSNLDDAATATVLLAQNGIKGSQAGTALRRVFTNLLEPTKAGAAAMEHLGLIVNGQNMVIDQHTGKMKNLTDIQAMLNKSTRNLTDAEKAKYAHDIFGQYALAGSLVLLNANSNAYENLKNKIDGINSTQAAASMLDTFNGHMKQLQAHVATTAKEFGMSFLPVLEKLIPIGNSILSFFQHLSPETKKLLMGVLALGSALMIAGGALASFAITLRFAKEGVVAIKDLYKAFTDFEKIGRLIGLVSNPWFLLIAGIVTGVVLIITHWKQIVDFVQKHFGVSIPGVLHSLGQAFETVWHGIQNVVTAVLDFVEPYIITAVTAIGNFWKQIWPELQQVFTFVWNVMKMYLAPIFAIWNAEFSLIFSILKAMWGPFWNMLLSVLKFVWDAIVGVIRVTWDIVSGIIKVGLDLLTGHWDAAWSDVKTIFVNVWNDIKNTMGSLLSDALSFGENFVKMIGNGIMAGVHWVEDAAKSVMSKIKGLLGFGSPTKEGEGSTSDRWAPNFVSMYADGLHAGVPTISNAVSALIKPLASLNGTGVTVHTGVTTPPIGTAGALNGSLTMGSPATMTMAGLGGAAARGGTNIGNIIIQISGAGKNGKQLGQDIVQHLRQQMATAY